MIEYKLLFVVFFFKQKTAYEIMPSLVGSEMCIRDSKKQTGGSGQFAKVLVSIEPFTGEDGATYEFENKVSGGRIPREYIPSVDAGAQDAMQYGVLAGYPLVNVKLILLDGAYHDVDSSEMAFKIAGSQLSLIHISE